jgi:LemA protein
MSLTLGGWIFLAVLALVIVYAIFAYNRFVALGQTARGAWSDIDVQLKRRADLVPSLVETVKGYAGHEQRTLTEVTRLRGAAAAAQEPQARAAAENALTQALRGLFALVESYPQLKADQNFLTLQAEISQVESDAQNARRYYNAVVRDLNTAIESFPANLVATVTGFRTRPFFELDRDGDRAVPRVSFER